MKFYGEFSKMKASLTAFYVLMEKLMKIYGKLVIF